MSMTEILFVLVTKNAFVELWANPQVYFLSISAGRASVGLCRPGATGSCSLASLSRSSPVPLPSSRPLPFPPRLTTPPPSTFFTSPKFPGLLKSPPLGYSGTQLPMTHELICPLDFFVTEIFGFSGLLLNGIGVTCCNLGVTCSNPISLGPAGATEVSSSYAAFSFSCPGGFDAVQVSDSPASYPTRVSFRCASAANTMRAEGRRRLHASSKRITPGSYSPQLGSLTTTPSSSLGFYCSNTSGDSISEAPRIVGISVAAESDSLLQFQLLCAPTLIPVPSKALLQSSPPRFQPGSPMGISLPPSRSPSLPAPVSPHPSTITTSPSICNDRFLEQPFPDSLPPALVALLKVSQTHSRSSFLFI